MNQRRWANVMQQMRGQDLLNPGINSNLALGELNDKKKVRHNGPLSINTVLHKFCNDTSTHGPAQIYRVQSIIGEYRPSTCHHTNVFLIGGQNLWEVGDWHPCVTPPPPPHINIEPKLFIWPRVCYSNSGDWHCLSTRHQFSKGQSL